MKRLRRRTIIALVLAGALAAGVLFFCFQLIGKGNDWVGFFGTRYYDSGAIYDRNGVLCAFFSFDMMNLVRVLNNEKDSPTAAR